MGRVRDCQTFPGGFESALADFPPEQVARWLLASSGISAPPGLSPQTLSAHRQNTYNGISCCSLIHMEIHHPPLTMIYEIHLYVPKTGMLTPQMLEWLFENGQSTTQPEAFWPVRKLKPKA